MMMDTGTPIIIFGASGHAKDVLHLINDLNQWGTAKYDVKGFIEKDYESIGKNISQNKKVVSCDDLIQEYILKFDYLEVILAIADNEIRAALYQRLKEFKNLNFPNLIHPTCLYDKAAIKIGIGNIISPKTLIQYDVEIGDFNCFGINSTIGHDVKIDSFNTLNTNAFLAGNVTLENFCLIGASASVLQGRHLEDHSIVGAGCLVTKDVNCGETVVGVPARVIKRRVYE